MIKSYDERAAFAEYSSWRCPQTWLYKIVISSIIPFSRTNVSESRDGLCASPQEILRSRLSIVPSVLGQSLPDTLCHFMTCNKTRISRDTKLWTGLDLTSSPSVLGQSLLEGLCHLAMCNKTTFFTSRKIYSTWTPLDWTSPPPFPFGTNSPIVFAILRRATKSGFHVIKHIMLPRCR